MQPLPREVRDGTWYQWFFLLRQSIVMADGTILDFFFNLSTHSRPVKRFSCSLLTLYSSEVCSMSDCEHCRPLGWGYYDPHAVVAYPNTAGCCVGLVVLFLATPLGTWFRAHEVHWLCFAGVQHTLLRRLKFFLPSSLAAHLLRQALRPGLLCWECQLGSVFFPGRYSTLRSNPHTLRIIACKCNGATDIVLRRIVLSGRWSVCTIVVFPRMYSLNLCALNTIANISFSMGAQMSSDLQSLQEA